MKALSVSARVRKLADKEYSVGENIMPLWNKIAMRRTAIISVILATLCLVFFGMGYSPATAAEVLVNGNLESSVSPVGWSLTTSVTGIPGSTIPEVVEHLVAPGLPAAGLSLLLHPQKGNQGIYEDQDKRVNLVLEQTFGSAASPAEPGRIYTFKGDVFIQDGYSGIVNILNPLYPKGDYSSDTIVDAADYVVWRKNLGAEFALNQEGPGVTQGMVTQEDYDYWTSKFGNVGRAAGVASPTVTKFEITFLNSSNAELGTTMYDLRSDPTTLAWRTTDMVQALAPATTQKVRVRVSALNMVDNCCVLGQDVFFDNFSLKDNGPFSSGTERLANGNLDNPGLPAGWQTTEGPMGTPTQGGPPVNADTIAFIAFANRLSNTPNPNPTPPYATLPTGKQGMWLQPSVNKTQFEPDLLDVFGHASQDFPNATAGAEYTFSAWSAWESGYSGGLFNTSTETFLKMEFLNGATVIDTETLDLVDAGQVPDDNLGTNENGGNVEFDDWRQFALNAVAPPLTTKVRVSVGATGMFNNDLDNFQAAFFDEMSLIETLPGAGGGGTVPEPGAMVLVGIAVALAGVVRRRGR